MESTLDLDLVQAEVTALRKRLRILIASIGEPDRCSGPSCKLPIFWVRHKNGARTPYDPDGVNHFCTCPDRAQFRRKQS